MAHDAVAGEGDGLDHAALRHGKGDGTAAEQALAAVHDGLEYRLRVGDRAADHAQDLGGRGLPLERLVGLVEQARVLDGDQRLVAEGLGERNFLAVESSGLLAEDRQGADRFAVAQQRNGERRRGRPAVGEP